jgi:hypothetical protein
MPSQQVQAFDSNHRFSQRDQSKLLEFVWVGLSWSKLVWLCCLLDTRFVAQAVLEGVQAAGFELLQHLVTDLIQRWQGHFA